MPPQTFLFIGRSGCGKGTQAKLLMDSLKKKDPKRDIFYLEMGQKFRDFIKKDGYTSALSNAIYEKGGLQPSFLTVYMWSDIFVNGFKDGEHLIIDGTPRRLEEAHVLDGALKFYGREKPALVYLRVGKKWSEEKLLVRKRADDNKEDIDARLAWFDTEVVPAIDFYRNNPDYQFVEVDGEQKIEKVHEDIINKIA
ncbi:MAG: nucleoside monophosphate kinase [bacterium]|nr:nucleoside monophosphate kinase [bacterium]